GLIYLMIGNTNQVAAIPTDHGVGAIDFRLLFRMALHVALDAIAREIRRIERVAWRHGLCAYERVMLVDKIPAGAVDHQQAPQFWIVRFPVQRESVRIA